MTNAILKHKGYSGSIKPSVEDQCLFGEILFINDLITYEGETLPQLDEAFKSAVERYLAHCKKIGKSPDKPFSGSFNVRLGAELHKAAALAAESRGVSLNDYVMNSVKICVEHNGIAKVEHTHKIELTMQIDNQFNTVTSSTSPMVTGWGSNNVRH